MKKSLFGRTLDILVIVILFIPALIWRGFNCCVNKYYDWRNDIDT